MRGALLASVAFGLLGGGAALGWDLIVETEEEQVEEIVTDVVGARDSGRAAAFLRHVSLEAHPVTVSAPGLEDRYDVSDEALLVDLATHAQGLLAGADLELVQSVVEVHGDTARATLNVGIQTPEGSRHVPLDLTLRRLGSDFVVTGIRIHH